MKVALVVTAVLAAAVGLLATAGGPDPDDVPSSDEVAARTMSPFCEGLTLNECPHSKSTALRAEIDAMIRQGATNREIDDWMARNYGVVSQARPGSDLAWLVPPALAALGVAGMLWALRRRTSPESPREKAPPPVLDEAEEARFAEDFRSYVRGTE
jgi:cytochrome c-type biogenesis protein CcmH/NrfF